MKFTRWVVLLLLVPILSGCKCELYGKLDEAEANQMLALLIYNKIPAEKVVSKDGVSLSVEQDKFVDAVEVLRQNGLPRRKTTTMQDLFPSGQLVTSPEQEAAKLNFLKSQELEKMLSSMDGVVDAEVSVAQPLGVPGEAPPPASAAVFIKYSPESNLPVHAGEIRALVRDGIPGLALDHISLSFQQAAYRFQPAAPAISQLIVPWQSIAAGSGILLLGAMLASMSWWRRRSERK